MFQFFRNFFKTKVGMVIALAFLGLIAVAFASADVSSSGSFGGIAGGDRVAVVGDEKIGTADLSKAASNALDRARREDPTISMQSFLAEGGMSETMNALIDRYAIRGYAREHGLRAGDNLVNSEIRSIPAFRGADGNFSEDTYRQVLAQQRISDAEARADLSTGLIAQQLFIPTTSSATMPDSVAYRYAQLFKERRKGSIATLPSAAFAPKGKPSQAQLKAYYDSNRAMFVRPERRVIRYAIFDADSLGDRIEPTAAEIAARYKRDAKLYAGGETRSFTQLIVPTEAAAKTIRDRIAGGGSLETAAREAGLRAAPVTDAERETITSQASAAVAQAYFSASEGAISQPARSALGWHLARIDKIEKVTARTLAQARGEITDAIRAEKRVSVLADRAIQIEEQFADGATLSEVADEFKLKVIATKPVIATGQIYGTAGETAPAVLAPALATAFQMEEEEAEVAPVSGGAAYLVYDVTDIVPAATAPLAQIAKEVEGAWRLDHGAKGAKAAADRILARVAKGQTLAAAVSAEKVGALKVEPVSLTREDLARQAAQRIPPAIALLFSMADGTTKKLEASGRLGWLVIDLDDVAMDTLDKDDPLVAQAKQQLGPVIGDEYSAQLRTAMRQAMGVERNPAAIEAVSKQLTGAN
ncbi:peptidylprolyl isomerase [Qipengyuania marisflavi]|uniref:Parvulin-like PPIase n=1 Tax=Qipengyuania marisflavi TaxID=2486356 RepID=A0A5S3P9G5_9SPHN|nr:peptidylprolyl isomerase [Qipengyuania marisflavi]TMM49963.1 peptidylprolyl isomerase [Qipengyuania marisflavi]